MPLVPGAWCLVQVSFGARVVDRVRMEEDQTKGQMIAASTNVQQLNPITITTTTTATHTHTHTHTHTRALTHTDTRAHANTHTHTHTRAHTHTHKCARAYTLPTRPLTRTYPFPTHPHTCAFTLLTHPSTHSLTHTHAHAHAHPPIHTHTHPHPHPCAPVCCYPTITQPLPNHYQAYTVEAKVAGAWVRAGYLSAPFLCNGEKVDFVCLIAAIAGRHGGGDQVHKVKKAAAPSFLYSAA